MKTLRNMMGNETRFAEGKVTHEIDFVMCGHCQTTVDVTPGKSVTDAGAYCSTCASIVCPRCAKAAARTGLCIPWEKAMDIEERNRETLKRWGYDSGNTSRLVLPR